MWTAPTFQHEEMSLTTLRSQMERKTVTMQYLLDTQHEVDETCRQVLTHGRNPIRASHPRKHSKQSSSKKNTRLFSVDKKQSSDFSDAIEVEPTAQPRNLLSRAAKVVLNEVKFAAKPWETDDFVPSVDPSAPGAEKKEKWGQTLVEPVTVEQFAQYKDHFEQYTPPCKPLGLVLGPHGWKLNDPVQQLKLPTNTPLPALTPAIRADLQAREAELRVRQYNIFKPTSFYNLFQKN